MLLRRPLAVLSVTVLVALTGVSTAGAASPAGPTYRANDYADGQIMSILPPGANGVTNATEAATYGATMLTGQTVYPPHSQDDLAKYNDLSYGYQSLTDSTLGDYYDDESFGIPPTGDTSGIIKTVSPESGVTVYYDGEDVPHVYGTNDDTMSFGAGYAQASERLFFMDVLRHYGAGTTSSFLGPSCVDEQMDHDQLLLAPYTNDDPTNRVNDATAQVNALPQEYGAKGQHTKDMIDSYVAGINAYIKAAQTDPSLLPVEYAALPTVGSVTAPTPVLPQPWDSGDVVSIAGLIGGIFGKGGGIEATDSALYTYLTSPSVLGAAGAQAYQAFKSPNDPDAPTTIVDKTFPYENTASTPKTPTALNDLPQVDPTTHQAVLTGGPTDTTANCDLTKPSIPGLSAIGAALTLPGAISNALVVNANRSTGGHPIAVFGPQVSYFAPQILMKEDLHSPTYAAEGASFPGTGVVELGRGEDYAWSATSAGTDLEDQRLEQICNPTGGPVDPNGTDYLFDGACVPMTAEDFSETALLPTAGGLGAPVLGPIDHKVFLTRHGVVQGWTKDKSGKVVALVTQRSTYLHDIDSVVGFVDWGTPSATHDEASWVTGATEIGFTFNWFYVDDRDTGYYVSGRDPVRPVNADPNLPLTGTGNSEWLGYLPASEHPQEVNPPQGFFVSWNNKPAPGFSAADDQFGYGSTYRSTMLVTQLKAQLAAHGGKVTRANVVQAMEAASSQDLDGLNEIPKLIAYLKAHEAAKPAGTPAADEQMLTLLSQWVATGAHRHKAQPGDAQYDHAAAVAISDEVLPDVIEAIWSNLLGPTGPVGNTGGAQDLGFPILPAQFTNTPHSGGANLGSAYDGGWTGYLDDTFTQLTPGGKTGDMFGAAVKATWCGGGGPTACPAAVWTALTKAEGALVTANGGAADPSTWTADTDTAATKTSTAAAETMPVYDAIHFRAVGLVATPAIDWQNRPTFQQVVEFPRHRPRTGSPVTTTPTTTTTAGGKLGSGTGGALAVTGGLPGALAALVLVAAGGALATTRRRRR